MKIELDIFENMFFLMAQITTTRKFFHMPKYVLQTRHTTCIFHTEGNIKLG